MDKINIVLEGRYKDMRVYLCKDHLEICDEKVIKDEISAYEVIDETNQDKYSLWKGALGVALFGGIGAIAGIGGKKKKEYLIAIEWIWPKNASNNKSLILIDEQYYKTFVRCMF